MNKIVERVTAALLNPKKETSLQRLIALAYREGLDDPIGRACYCASRKQNETVYDELGKMKACLPRTAKKWREHYEAGGSLKSLKKFKHQSKGKSNE